MSRLISKKPLKTNNFVKALAFILGFFFICSGLSKVLDLNYFINTLNRYHSSFEILYPLIISIEILIGSLLIFQYNLKTVGLYALVLLTMFTIVFVTGYYFLGIDNCGCFGKTFELSPTQSVSRNIVLILISVLIFELAKQKEKSKGYILWLSVSLCLISGTTSLIILHKIDFKYKTGYSVSKTFLEYKTKKEPYIVAFLSPHCAQCKNQLKHSKSINSELIVLYPNYFSKKEIDKFLKDNNLTFRLNAISQDSLSLVASSFPTFIYIKNGRITRISNKLN
ncbi:MauE/DoxX family redox-associated membrane protein [Lacihabitans lacunae]|uniref:MauE/DoxX family redox-associated membrane protein n=1 Tax=Lacihabitans lacunae TaxID=1028214 RepID=A0ABV7Z4C0_9BACT